MIVTLRDCPEYTLQAKALYKYAFSDGDAFIEAYFAERGKPEYTYCYICDNNLVSMLHAIPLTGYVKGNPVSVRLIAGVATHPEYRRRGYSSELIRYVHDTVRTDAFILQPANEELFGFYERSGYRPLCRYYRATFPNTARFTGRENPPTPDKMQGIIRTFSQRFDSVFCDYSFALREYKLGTCFFACTDRAFALCSDDGDTCRIMYVTGEFSDELLKRICSQTEKEIIEIISCDPIWDGEPVFYNMIKAEYGPNELGRVLSNLYY